MPDQKHTIVTGSFSYKHPKLYVARGTVYFCVWFVTSASSTVRYSHVMVCCLSSKAKLVVDLFQKLAFFDYLVVLADFQKPGYGVGNDEN